MVPRRRRAALAVSGKAGDAEPVACARRAGEQSGRLDRRVEGGGDLGKGVEEVGDDQVVAVLEVEGERVVEVALGGAGLPLRRGEAPRDRRRPSPQPRRPDVPPQSCEFGVVTADAGRVAADQADFGEQRVGDRETLDDAVGTTGHDACQVGFGIGDHPQRQPCGGRLGTQQRECQACASGHGTAGSGTPPAVGRPGPWRPASPSATAAPMRGGSAAACQAVGRGGATKAGVVVWLLVVWRADGAFNQQPQIEVWPIRGLCTMNRCRAANLVSFAAALAKADAVVAGDLLAC